VSMGLCASVIGNTENMQIATGSATVLGVCGRRGRWTKLLVN